MLKRKQVSASGKRGSWTPKPALKARIISCHYLHRLLNAHDCTVVIPTIRLPNETCTYCTCRLLERVKLRLLVRGVFMRRGSSSVVVANFVRKCFDRFNIDVSPAIFYDTSLQIHISSIPPFSRLPPPGTHKRHHHHAKLLSPCLL
jgi:hypothetical protein